MRRFVRPFLLFSLLALIASQVKSQGGVNQFYFNPGYPAATTGGVDVIVNLKAASGWKCTQVTIDVVEDSTGLTLDTYTTTTPGKSVGKSFTGLPNNVKCEVIANGTFQSGGNFDFKTVSDFVTTN